MSMWSRPASSTTRTTPASRAGWNGVGRLAHGGHARAPRSFADHARQMTPTRRTQSGHFSTLADSHSISGSTVSLLTRTPHATLPVSLFTAWIGPRTTSFPRPSGPSRPPGTMPCDPTHSVPAAPTFQVMCPASLALQRSTAWLCAEHYPTSRLLHALKARMFTNGEQLTLDGCQSPATRRDC